MERVSYPVGPPGGVAGVLQADGLMRDPLFHEARQATRQAMQLAVRECAAVRSHTTPVPFAERGLLSVARAVC